MNPSPMVLPSDGTGFSVTASATIRPSCTGYVTPWRALKTARSSIGRLSHSFMPRADHVGAVDFGQAVDMGDARSPCARSSRSRRRVVLRRQSSS